MNPTPQKVMDDVRSVRNEFSHCTSGGLLQLVLQTDVLLLQESDLGGDLTDRVQTLDVDVGRSTWRGQGDFMISVCSCFASVRFLTNLAATKPV